MSIGSIGFTSPFPQAIGGFNTFNTRQHNAPFCASKEGYSRYAAKIQVPQAVPVAAEVPPGACLS